MTFIDRGLQKQTSHARLLLAVAAAIIVTVSLGFLSIANAITTISQGYSTEAKIPIGSIVSLEDNTTNQVIAATTATVDNLVGVVINTGNALLTLTDGSESAVQVATSGTVQVLVSDMNGTISQGDHITASPITGVGMKATDNIRIAGIAQGNLTQTNGHTENYTDSEGAKKTVLLGQIPMLVNVSYYFKEPDKTIIPSALQNIANALAGKDVSSLPIILSSAVFLVMLIVVVSIIYSMIRSSIISVGRNPLSQSAVYRDVIQLSGLVIGILAVGLIAIYLILTRL